MKQIITNPKYQIEKRRELRQNMTIYEIALWKVIKNKQLEGRKFRRQFGVGKYILDFYCPSEKLAIELDGADHFTSSGMENDEERDDFLKKEGIKVQRIENKHVFKNMENVIQLIIDNFKKG